MPAWDFEVVGWEDREGHRHEGKPSDLSETYGVVVRAEDEDTGEYDHFMAYVGNPFDTWMQWVEYIYALMISNYGMELVE